MTRPPGSRSTQSKHDADADHAPSSSSSTHPPLSSLRPKPCVTCGREITPRAKWANDWAAIRTCSEGCRGLRPGQLGTGAVVLRWRWQAPGPSSLTGLGLKDGQSWRTPVALVLRARREDQVQVHVQDPGQEQGPADGDQGRWHWQCTLDVEAWLELALVDAALHPAKYTSARLALAHELEDEDEDELVGLQSGKTSQKTKAKGKAKAKAKAKGKGSMEDMPLCDDVERAIEEDARRLVGLLPTSPQGSEQAQGTTTGTPAEEDAQDDGDKDAAEETETKRLTTARHPLLRALEVKPGLRERVRRAARRLAVLDPSDWALHLDSARTSHDGDLDLVLLHDNDDAAQLKDGIAGHRLELWNEGRRMESLSMVSHAKGPIGLRLVPMAT